MYVGGAPYSCEWCVCGSYGGMVAMGVLSELMVWNGGVCGSAGCSAGLVCGVWLVFGSVVVVYGP